MPAHRTGRTADFRTALARAISRPKPTTGPVTLSDQIDAVTALIDAEYGAPTDLLKVAEWALEWIDAVPKEVAASLPVMPGFDRDWANQVIERAALSASRSTGET